MKSEKLVLTDGVVIPVIAIESCPGCAGNQFEYYGNVEYKGALLNYSRCLDCGLVFMNPVPLQAWYDEFYSRSFLDGKESTIIEDGIAKDLKQWQKQVVWASKFVKFIKDANLLPSKSGKILEIGCAFGIISKLIADEFECEADGIEPMPAVARFASEKMGVNVVGKTAADLPSQPDASYDIVLCSHVLENVVDVKEAIRQIKRILKSSGVVIVDTPNNFYQNSMGIFHPYIFNEKSLNGIFANEGLVLYQSYRSGLGKSYLFPRYITMFFGLDAGKAGAFNFDSNDFFKLRCLYGKFLSKLSAIPLIRRLDMRLVKKNLPLLPSGVFLLDKLKRETRKNEAR